MNSFAQKLHVGLTLLLLGGAIFLSLKLMTRQELSLITIAQMRASDPAQPVARRLEAFRVLRAHGLAESYLCPEAVVESMLQLASETSVPAVRAEIYRQLAGIQYAIVRKPLIDALLNDVSAEAREEAARALGPLRDDPDVQSALTQTQEKDGSDRVRMQSAASLAGENSMAQREGGGWGPEQ